MYSIKNKASIIIQNIALFLNLFLNLDGRSECKDTLGINTAAPENKLIAIFLFKNGRIHPCSIYLNRVYNIETRFDEMGHKWLHSSAGVFKCFPVCILMYPVVDFPVIRQPYVIKGLGGTECGILGTEICPTGECNIYPVTNYIMQKLQVFNSYICLPVIDLLNVFFPCES